ncbi:MAG: Xaa-Pro peptidase family protein [Bacteroidota bacterium]
MSKRRLALLRETMRQEKFDAFVVSALPHIRYLAGFSGSNALCIVRRSDVFFLTDSRYTLQSKHEVKGWKRGISSNDLFDECGKRGLFRGCRRIGFESHSLTYAQYRRLKKVSAGASFVPTTDIIEALVVVKQRGEVECMREAISISDRVFGEIIGKIKPGVAELDIAAEISYLHKTHGAEKDAFEPIVASGERGALPHARASGKRIKRGELVTLDFGCSVRGYNSDITRTVAVGRPTAEAKKMYHVVLHAQCAAIDAAKGGMSAKKLDAVARGCIAKEGYGRYFTHSLGHGLGLQVHERPRVSSLSKEQLQVGSVITIEPGVYIPRLGGVRIEDDVLLKPDGCEVLNSAPKEFMVV